MLRQRQTLIGWFTLSIMLYVSIWCCCGVSMGQINSTATKLPHLDCCNTPSPQAAVTPAKSPNDHRPCSSCPLTELRERAYSKSHGVSVATLDICVFAALLSAPISHANVEAIGFQYVCDESPPPCTLFALHTCLLC